MQGVVATLGGELGDWTVLKASLKVVFPSIHASTGPPSSVPLISIDSKGDDGKFGNIGLSCFVAQEN